GCAGNEAKPRGPARRGEQPGRLAANEAGCARISLRCASMRRKIALNSPGIWGMSAKMAPQLVSRVSPGLQAFGPGANETRQNDGGYSSRLLFTEETDIWRKK